jgi:tetratricopeptide (TPR) repeat protein
MRFNPHATSPVKTSDWKPMRMSVRFAALIMLAACGALASLSVSAAQAPANETLTQKQAACQRGDMPACTRAGRAYENGTGVQASPATAATLYRKACDGKDGDGCARLGWLNFTGKGVPRNFDAGYALIEKGCDVLESGEACYLMATVHFSSESEDFRAPGSRKLMAACGYGYLEGCYDMALNFLEGKNGFTRDAAGAIVILDIEACAKGHARSCSLLAYLYREGKVIPADIAKADAFARKGCELKSPACERAAPAARTPAPAPAPAGMQSATDSGGIANSGVNFGASIATVRQSLAGRRIEILPATDNLGWHRLVACCDEFSDIDPRLVRLTYEFDAPEGPAAKLIGVVLAYRRDSSTQSAVYSERVSTLSKRYPLAPQTPTKLEANVSGTVVSLIDDAKFGLVYESYRVPPGTSAPAAVQRATVPSQPAGASGAKAAMAAANSDAGKLLTTADVQFEAKSYGPAEESYLAVRRLDPNNYRAAYQLGWIYNDKSRFKEAAAQLQDAVRIDPSHPSAFRELGLAYRQLKRYDEAIDAYTRSLKQKADDIEAIRGLGIVYAMDVKRHAEGIEQFRKVLRINPNDSDAYYYGIGWAYNDTEKYAEAIDALKESARLEPNGAPALRELGYAYRNLKRNDEAIDAYTRSIKLDADDAESQYGLGDVYYYNLKRYATAAQQYQKALRIKPGDGAVNFKLGWCYNTLYRYGEAVSVLKEASRLLPNDANSRFELGYALANQSMTGDAILAYKDAIRLAPKHVAAHYELGKAYKMQGDRAAAMEQYQILVPLDAAEAKKLLEVINTRLASKDSI